MELAFNSKHPNVQKNNRWIASINDGSTIFEDKTPGIITAWRRLANYIQNQKLKITNLRLEFANKTIEFNDKGNIDGFWWSMKEESFFGESINQNFHWVGIGQVKSGLINIIWVENSGQIKEELRVLKNNDPAVIMNNLDGWNYV